MDKVQAYEAKLEEQLSKAPLFKKLEKTVGVPKTYLFLGGSTFITLLLVFNLGGAFISDLIGWSFPAYFSLRALDKKSTDEYNQWVSYWCLFGLINLLEFFSPVLSYLIPFYFLIKTMALLWLFLPNYRGAEYTYKAFLQPTYLKFNSFVSDSDSCEVPSMKDATNALKSSATAAAAQLEKTAQEAKKEIEKAITPAKSNDDQTASAPKKKETHEASESKSASTEGQTDSQQTEEKKDV